VNRHLRNALSWAGMALTVWGLVLLVPDWFGRPSSAWWLIGAGTALGLGLAVLTFHRRDAETGLVVGIFSFVGFVSLAGGLAIVATAIVRSVAISDGGALPLGFLCLVIGGLIGILLIGAAIRLLTPRPADSED
jgi:drug/metabolite transporter (DMT)-like permease